MAYIEGESLKQRISRGPLPFDEAIETCTQVALGLREAHSKGIVHRDIKPSNLLINRSGVVRIVDFGLALLPVDEELTRENLSVGTPGYMSPEQVRAETVDHRSDLWALADNRVSVTPLRLDLTDEPFMTQLAALFDRR